ncbi:hypothetical protein KAR91_67190 [Candidatus Pacearchaeota archaeon]|nr:hypothetical protein [Candidatus Pacearchaeota archaeon]
MNSHLAIIYTLPMALFIGGLILFLLDNKWYSDKIVRKIGAMFMLGGILIAIRFAALAGWYR